MKKTLKWKPSEHKNWYHLKIRACKLGPIQPIYHISYIVQEIMKKLIPIEEENY